MWLLVEEALARLHHDGRNGVRNICAVVQHSMSQMMQRKTNTMERKKCFVQRNGTQWMEWVEVVVLPGWQYSVLYSVLYQCWQCQHW